MLLDDLNPYASLFSLVLMIIIAAITGSRVVFKYVQKRHAINLANEINTHLLTTIKPIDERLERHSRRLLKLETQVENLDKHAFPSRRRK